MITKVQNKKDLKRFIYYAKDLYKDDPHYIYPLFYILKRELIQEVLIKKDYTALLSTDESGKLNGRLLYRIEYNLKEDKKTAYFSYFDAIDSDQVTTELFNYMKTDMIANDTYYMEGSFTPYDPDTRRGILINNFDSDPILFTSYNKSYIPKLLENYGFTKSRDTFSVKPEISEANEKRLNKFSEFFERRHKIDVDMIDIKNMDQEIDDIHKVLLEADNEHIYQETPSIELLKSVAINLKAFLDPRIIRIARERETKKPVAFFFCLPDYNQVFKRTKGHIRPLKILFGKKHITSIRAMMQYVIPEYQNTGLIAYSYKAIFEQLKIMGVNHIEAGTIMENNYAAMTAFKKFGGDPYKIYRIYGKEITK